MPTSTVQYSTTCRHKSTVRDYNPYLFRGVRGSRNSGSGVTLFDMPNIHLNLILTATIQNPMIRRSIANDIPLDMGMTIQLA